MSTFGMLLKTYRERTGLSQNELAAQAGLSASTISRVEGGERGPLGKRRQVIALAKALGLSQIETDTLLSAADLAPSTALELSLHPRDETLYQIAQELEGLRTDPQITPAQIRFVEETLLLVLRGARAALPQADLAVVPSGAPSARSLSEEERYLDDLLGDCIAGRLPKEAMPFAVFAAVARSPRWELKRRLAEALPALLRVDVEWTIPLMETLRDDPPDPEWRTDIRRRVIEAAPELWLIRPEAASALLRWREGDEVYAALASLDALAELSAQEPPAGIPAGLRAEIQEDLLAHAEEEHREAVALYAQVLGCCTAGSVLHDPDAAVTLIQRHLDSEERLIRICMARSLHHLLPLRPAETLKLMRYFLRQENGHPAEHQNVRRAVARHPDTLIGLLDGAYDEAALRLLRTLTGDRDVHVRRAIGDVLTDVVELAPGAALDLIEEYLLQDRDHFVQERTWNALRQLMSAGSERAEELCARLIEIA
jgi:transcriptional regulator with XRE-family HTH domain/ketosteroid isomerase-like protein